MYFPRIRDELLAFFGSVEHEIATVFDAVIGKVAQDAGTVAKDAATSAINAAIASLGKGASAHDIITAAYKTALATVTSEGKTVGEADLLALLAAVLSTIQAKSAS